ncbi:MAG: LLM class F420-dependent oxidoreductase [Chloroflexota bacterium]|nr:LLM class F420-dependent oxidoreductase [Chloroflexota bacterium]
MRLSTRVGYGDGFVRTVERVVALEQVGVDMVWVAEAYGFDAATQLGYLAARTRRVELGSGIFNIYSRSPALLAQTAAGLDDLSDGRAILGLGASGPQVVEGWHGLPYDQPVPRMREIIDICRMAWRRQELVYSGRCYSLPLPPERGAGLGKPIKMLTHPRRERIPIYLASLGERSVELAAEKAEGWLPIFFWPEQAEKVWGAALRRGLARRSADVGPLQIVAGGPLAIGDGLESLRDRERPHLALYAGGMGARGKNFYNDLLRQYGYEREAAEIQELYLNGRKQQAAACVPAALLEALQLIGPAEYVKERIGVFKAAGVSVLDVQPIGPDPLGDVARVREWLAAL